MPIFMERAIDVKPFDRGTDVSIDGTGFHLPAAADVTHSHTNDVLTLNFTLTGNALHLDVELLVPAVQTDFFSG